MHGHQGASRAAPEVSPPERRAEQGARQSSAGAAAAVGSVATGPQGAPELGHDTAPAQLAPPVGTRLTTGGASAHADELEARGTVRACATAGSFGATCGATCWQRILKSRPCITTRRLAARSWRWFRQTGGRRFPCSECPKRHL